MIARIDSWKGVTPSTRIGIARIVVRLASGVPACARN